MFRKATFRRTYRPATTPLGKLAQMFEGLENRGLIARGRFACCHSCGCYDMHQRFEKSADGCKPLGFVFFHDQDWENYLECGELWLSYGSFTGLPEHIGCIITDALDIFGLDYEWDGKGSTRIRIRMGKPIQRQWRGYR